jgi:hypothetical protein
VPNKKKAGADIEACRSVSCKRGATRLYLESPLALWATGPLEGRGAGERVERRRSCFTTLARAGQRVVDARVFFLIAPPSLNEMYPLGPSSFGLAPSPQSLAVVNNNENNVLQR